MRSENNKNYKVSKMPVNATIGKRSIDIELAEFKIVIENKLQRARKELVHIQEKLI